MDEKRLQDELLNPDFDRLARPEAELGEELPLRRGPPKETSVGDVLVDTVRLDGQPWSKGHEIPFFQNGYAKRNAGLLTYMNANNRLSAGEILFPARAGIVLLDRSGTRMLASTPLRRWLEDNVFVRIEINRLLWLEGMLGTFLDEGLPLQGTQTEITGNHEITGTLKFLRDYTYEDKPDLEARFVLRGARATATTRG